VQKGALAYRVQGTLEAVNYLSYVCVVMVPVLLSIFVYLRDRRAKAFVLALTLAAMFVSLQTASRSGYYALIATLGFLAFRFARRPQLVVAALAFGFVFYELLPAQLLQRLSEVEDIRQSSRYVLSQIGLRMMLDNPLFGVGFGQRAYMAMFPNYDYEHLTHPQAPHSLYFAIGACHGIPALVAYLAIFVVSFQQLLTVERDYRRSRQTHALGYFLAVGLQSAIVGHLIFGLAGSYGDSYYAYLVLGLSVILVRLHQERAHAPLV
jgi:O-antigen ligase